MNVYLAWTAPILSWIIYPIGLGLYSLAVVLFAIASFLYRPIAFFLQPLVYLGRFLLAFLALPVRLLIKLEPLYNYLAIAAFTGIIGGLALAYAYKACYRMLQLEGPITQKPARDARQYRETKAKKKADMEPPHFSASYLSPSDSVHSKASKGRQRNLLSPTIMEQLDSDY